MTDYRTRIYNEYATQIQDATSNFNAVNAVNLGVGYNNYLRKWLPKNKGAAILDIACGDGRILFFLKSKGYTNLTGVDISPEQVALSRQVIKNIYEENAISFLEKNESTYDLILGMDIIEHLNKMEALNFLDACYSALSPIGRIILQTPNAESPMGMKIRYGDFTHEIAFTSNSLKRLMSLCGFCEIESQEAAPVIHGFKSIIRYFIWRIIRIGILVWNLSETGDKGSGIFTRVFFISGVK